MTSFKSNAFFYAAIVTIGGLVFGLDIGVIAGALGYIREQFNLTDIQLGTVGAAPGFGAIFGLLLTGSICDRIGRKRSIQIIALMYFVSALASALAPGYGLLLAARFLGGLAFCSLSLASMYIGEIAPADMRGKLVSMNQINIVVGVTAAYFINYLIQQMADSGADWTVALNLQQTAWRYMLGSEVIPALIWVILVMWIPESPRWLMSVGHVDEARTSMKKLIPESEIEAEIASIQHSVDRHQGSTTKLGQLLELLGPHARMTAIIGVVIAAVQPITGINAILIYAPIVFEQTGIDDPLMTTIWIGVVSVLATIVAILVVDRLGRRPVVIFGLLWCALSLGMCAWGFQQARYELTGNSVALVQERLGEENVGAFERLGQEVGVEYADDISFMKAMRSALGDELADQHKNFLIGKGASLNAGLILFAILSFIAAYNVSIGPVMWVVFSEIFPTNLRGIAIPGAHLVTTIVSYLVQQFFPWQLANMGAKDIFLFYCACVSVGMVILFFILPETRNKSIEEIEAIWSREDHLPAAELSGQPN